MGSTIKTQYRMQARRGGGQGSTDRLKLMLVENYSDAKQAFDQLPTAEAKQQFLSIFEDFSEADFQMGSWRVEMVLELIDDETVASEALDSLNSLINQYSMEIAGQEGAEQ